MPLLFYIIFFYVAGIILWVTNKYDLFTISMIFGIFAVFLGFGGLPSFLYLILVLVFIEGVTLLFDKKHGKRSYVNLLGNCLAGSAFLAFGQTVAGLTSIAGSFSDTFSSEIGRLSKRKPRMITTFKKVEKGQDGGITLMGLGGSLLSAIITFCFFYFLFKWELNIVLVISIVGFFGTIFDSYIGALFETRGYLDNAQTNFLATTLTGLVAFIIMLFM